MRNSISTTLRLFVVAVSAIFMVAFASPAQAVLPAVHLVNGFGPHSNEFCMHNGAAEIDGVGMPHNGSFAVTFGSVIPFDSGTTTSGGQFASYVERHGMKGTVNYQVYVFDNSGNLKFSTTIDIKWVKCFN